MRTEKLTAAADTAAGTIAVTFGDAFEEGSFAVMLCDTEENVLIRVVRLAAKSAKPEYYGIKTAEDLRKFAEAVNSGRSYDRYRDESGDVVLLGDIDMTGTTEWTPIGTAENPFTGKFDGKGYTIKNIGWTADAAKSTAHGLFGVLEPSHRPEPHGRRQGRQAHRPGNRRSRHGRSRCGGVRHGISDRKRNQQRLDLVRGRRPRRSAGYARGNRRTDDRYDHRRNLRSGGVRQ